MTDAFPRLVSTQWLDDHRHDQDLVIIDASKHLPGAARNASGEHEAARIPGAHFLDLESLTDTSSSVPDAVPTEDQLYQRLAQLGVSSDYTIVLYDDSAIKTSARAWFILKAYGFDKIAILDGGLARWREQNRPLESGPRAPILDAAKTGLSDSRSQISVPAHIASKADMIANLQTRAHQVLDARAGSRVFGTGIDPVHGGPNGRIPGSLNLPFDTLFASDGTYKSPAELRGAFEQAGIDLNRPIITTCGSGMTACTLMFALELLGQSDVWVYDGSWLEWSADPTTPKAQGPQGTAS